MTGTTGLATLVERGLVAPDWAEALAPVDGQITAMGEFLRAEVRGRARPTCPHGDHVLRAFSRPLADVRVLVVGQDPYPTPGHAVGLSFSVAPDVRPLPRSLVNIYKELVDDLGCPPPLERRPHPVVRAGRDAAQPVPHGPPGRARLAPRPRLGGGHRARDRGARRPGRSAGRGPLGPRRAGPQAGARRRCPWVESVHPSPLSASRGFFGSRPFSRVNTLLEKQGGRPVDWRLP